MYSSGPTRDTYTSVHSYNRYETIQYKSHTHSYRHTSRHSPPTNDTDTMEEYKMVSCGQRSTLRSSDDVCGIGLSTSSSHNNTSFDRYYPSSNVLNFKIVIGDTVMDGIRYNKSNSNTYSEPLLCNAPDPLRLSLPDV